MTSPVGSERMSHRAGRRRLAAKCFVAVLVWLVALMPSAFGDEMEYRLGAGDRVRITIFGQEDLSGEFEVGSEGNISFPLVGEIKAGDSTLRELEIAIVDKLKPDYLKSPRVSIEVLNYRPFYIIGEVNKPGSYPYVTGMRVVNAVALAGGYTYRARESKVAITRVDGQRLQATPDTIVLPGDIIEIPERFF